MHQGLPKPAEFERNGLDEQKIRTNLLEILASGKTKLSPKQLLEILEDRLNNPPTHYTQPSELIVPDIMSTLRKNRDALRKLCFMEETGGEPNVATHSFRGYRFRDLSPESPLGRRALNYPEVLELANKFGIDLMSEGAYREMQKTGYFDLNSRSWLKGFGSGRVPVGSRDRDPFPPSRPITVNHYNPNNSGLHRGWRGEILVPKGV